MVNGLVAVASSSVSESDSLPVSTAVQSTKVLQEPIQTTEKWWWKNFPHVLCADESALHTSMHLQACTYVHPLFNIPRSASGLLDYNILDYQAWFYYGVISPNSHLSYIIVHKLV